jgi:iron complex transport system permease protein
MNPLNLNSRLMIRNGALLFTGIILLAVAILVSFTIGRYPVEIADLLTFVFSGKSSDENLSTIIYNIRLPRISGAVLAGGVLSVAGTSYQSMFRNPLVSPDILGVTSGAGFGAALAILFSFNTAGIQLLAFTFGIAAVVLAYAISRSLSNNSDKTLMLVLSGMVVSALFASLVSLVKFLADTDTKLPSITFWLMGSMASINMNDIKVTATVALCGIIPLMLVSWRMNVLSFGDEEARAMGVNTDWLRLLIVICASLITASVIAVSGHIGWVGLIIPHLSRLITGPDNKVLIPFSFLLGATFLLLVDDMARSLSSLEIPLGIITSLVGLPFFLLFLKRSRSNNW